MAAPRSARLACALAALSFPLSAQGTLRVTAAIGGGEPDGPSRDPAITADGRFVVFTSFANNLVANDIGPNEDVFLYDASTGAIELISVRIAPSSESYVMSAAAVSADGNLVCYSSTATNLVPGDDAVSDVFVRDRALATTTRITAGWPNGSYAPTISADGSCVAFTSDAVLPVPSGPFADVFRFDRGSGQFALVSVNSLGQFGNFPSGGARLSADGRYVAFESVATNFAPGDSNNAQDVFVHDALLSTTRRASLGAFANELAQGSRIGTFSDDGRLLCFDCRDGGVTSGDIDGVDDVFVRDRVSTGVVRASVPASNRGGDGTSNGGRMSNDGRWVAFRSDGTDLVAPDPTPGVADAFLKDLQTGSIEIVSRADDGSPISAEPGVDVSDDGRWIVFVSRQASGPGDSQSVFEIHLRDRGAVVYTTPCAGDGSGAPCPCGNPGQPGNGCENYAILGGVRLSATGTPSLANDTLRLDLSGFVTLDTPIAFVQGDALLNGGLGAPFGDGLQCVGGTTVRFGRRIASGGVSAYGAGVAGDAPLSVAGHVAAAGSTRYYQCVYFNFGSFCGQLRRNWSNSIAIVWNP